MNELGPVLPANWYLLGPVREFGAGSVVSRTVGSQELVIWRSADGAPIVMRAHCVHMGCHLGGSDLQGGKLRCPLHYRLIGGDGRFASTASNPLRQPTFPAREFMDGLFVFLGDPETAGDLDRLNLVGNASCYAGEHDFPLPWQWLVANGLDIEHLSAVHDRELIERPGLEITEGRELTVRYRTRPRGTKVSDRLMMRLATDGVHGKIRSLGGSMMLVEARVGKRETFILMSFVPQQDGTRIRGIVGLRGANTLLGQLSARIARALFKSFLYKDLHVLERIRWHEPPQVDGLGDEYMQRVCTFFRGLPDA